MVVSPNGVYTLRSRVQAALATLGLDSQSPHWGRLRLQSVAASVHAEWINEKPVFVSARWHDGLRSDLVVDAESLQFLAADTAHRGADANWAWLAGDCTPEPPR